MDDGREPPWCQTDEDDTRYQETFGDPKEAVDLEELRRFVRYYFEVKVRAEGPVGSAKDFAELEDAEAELRRLAAERRDNPDSKPPEV